MLFLPFFSTIPDLLLFAAAAVPDPAVESAASAAATTAAPAMDWVTRSVWTALQLACAIFYGRLFFRALTARGRVRAERFGLPEAGIAGLLSVLILLMMAAGFLMHARMQSGGAAPATPSGTEIINTLVNTFVFELLLVVGLLAGWAARHIPIAETLGLEPSINARWTGESQPPAVGRVIWIAMGFVLTAYPLLIGATELIQHLTGISPINAGQEEEAIRLFKASAALWPKSAMILSAVVVAPLVEEFVFRGYLYPVFRRYLGAGAGVLLNSALFAGVHLHLPSLAPLFVLSVCLTLAYEASGSLLVPIAMHALFNSFNVALLILGFSGAGS